MGIKLVEARDEEGIRKGREVSLLLSTPVCQEVLRQLQYPLWLLTTLVSTGPLLCALLSLGRLERCIHVDTGQMEPCPSLKNSWEGGGMAEIYFAGQSTSCHLLKMGGKSVIFVTVTKHLTRSKAKREDSGDRPSWKGCS